MHGLALKMGAEHYRALGELVESVRTLRPRFAEVWGAPVPRYLAEHVDTAEAFNAAMAALTAETIAATLQSYDFSLCAPAGRRRRWRRPTGERGPPGTSRRAGEPARANVGVQARRRFVRESMGSRTRADGGDFLKAVPRGGDLYVLSPILQGLGEDAVVALLERCAQAGTTGRVLVAELMTSADNRRITTLEDLHVLVVTPGGRVRSQHQHVALFAAAGLRPVRLARISTLVSYTLIEAAPREVSLGALGGSNQ